LMRLEGVRVCVFVRQWITAVQSFRCFLAPNVLHNRTADFAVSCFPLALANPVMGQDTTAALAVSRLTILVPASLHVLPQGLHLGAESGGTFGSQLALGGMSQQEETLLLLADDFLRITAATTSADAVATRRVQLQIPMGERIDLLLSITPTAHAIRNVVIVVVRIAAHNTSHDIPVIDRIHAATGIVSSLGSEELLELLRIVWLQFVHQIRTVRLMRFQILGDVLQSIPESALVHVLFLRQGRPI
jgi:hypothetical protein